jgi:hypothetical protein
MNADSIQYALETDWPVGRAGFEPPHISALETAWLAGAAGFEPLHFGIRSAGVGHRLRQAAIDGDKLTLTLRGTAGDDCATVPPIGVGHLEPGRANKENAISSPLVQNRMSRHRQSGSHGST